MTLKIFTRSSAVMNAVLEVPYLFSECFDKLCGRLESTKHVFFFLFSFYTKQKLFVKHTLNVSDKIDVTS